MSADRRGGSTADNEVTLHYLPEVAALATLGDGEEPVGRDLLHLKSELSRGSKLNVG
ncbi:hypothetical protein KAX17_07835 [Candidatus Bipolaricaulota bacterium]|nr:hypothetical protein [Candidatus Bipolaricaulota bacterium]